MAAMRRGAPPRVPAPYGYVPLLEGPLERRHPGLRQGHDRFRFDLLSGWLTGAFVALTPVHVGSGGIERTAHVAPAHAPAVPLVRAVVRAAGVPVLPGSTLKGALRSVVEAIAPTCVSVRGRATLVPAPLHACRRRDELCVGCRLFGAPGYASRLRCADARAEGAATTVAQAPHAHVARAVAGRAAPGRRFYRHGRPARGPLPLEVCPEGTRFVWRLDFDNLLPAELGLVLLALGQGEPPLRLKLGGHRPACFGSVEFQLETLRVVDPTALYLEYDGVAPDNRTAHETEDTPAFYVQAALESGLVLHDHLEQLRAIARYPGERDCPAGGY